MSDNALTAGTRGSNLALTQTELITEKLDCEVKIRTISTRGDKIRDVALSQVSGKGFFTKEIDEALLRGEIDIAVHSFKDLPTELPRGIVIGAVPERGSIKDALAGPYASIGELPRGAKVGTSSIRRRAELRHFKSDIAVKELRGNIDTRMTKLAAGLYDAIIVAESGLRRLGYRENVFTPLDPEVFIPAPSQGALAVTARAGDDRVLARLEDLEDGDTRRACECERAFLEELQGGCQVPAGIHTAMDGAEGTIRVLGFVSSLDGERFIRARESGRTEEGKRIGRALARRLLDAGGAEILDEIRNAEVFK